MWHVFAQTAVSFGGTSVSFGGTLIKCQRGTNFRGGRMSNEAAPHSIFGPKSSMLRPIYFPLSRLMKWSLINRKGGRVVSLMRGSFIRDTSFPPENLRMDEADFGLPRMSNEELPH